MEVDDYEVSELTEPPAMWFPEELESFNETNSNPSELVNKVTTTIPFLPLGLGIIIVCLLGLLGNILSALVLSRKKLHSSYTVLTLGLTLVDSIYLITKFLRYGIASLFEHYRIAHTYLFVLLPISGPYLRAITFTAHTASTYFTIAIAVDRYIAVRRPVFGRKYCTEKCARLISLLVIVWSFVFNVTRWLEFETVKLDASTGTEESQSDALIEAEEAGGSVSPMDGLGPIYFMNVTELRTNSTYKEVYIFWIYLIIMFIVPFVSLSILNIFIFLGVRQMMRDSVSLTSTQKRDTSFAIMLIGVVLVFLLCNLDYLMLDILDYSGVYFSEFWNHLGNFLLTINSAVNFIIYCVCGWKFRQECWRLIRDICPCLKQHRSHDIVVTDECQWVKETMEHIDMQTIPRVSLSKATSKSHM